MCSLAKKKITENSGAEVAENLDNQTDYHSYSEVNKGTEMTYEQLSDAFFKGTIDEEIDNDKSKEN